MSQLPQAPAPDDPDLGHDAARLSVGLSHARKPGMAHCSTRSRASASSAARPRGSSPEHGDHVGGELPLLVVTAAFTHALPTTVSAISSIRPRVRRFQKYFCESALATVAGLPFRDGPAGPDSW